MRRAPNTKPRMAVTIAGLALIYAATVGLNSGTRATMADAHSVLEVHDGFESAMTCSLDWVLLTADPDFVENGGDFWQIARHF
jgi:hypothetical protein